MLINNIGFIQNKSLNPVNRTNLNYLNHNSNSISFSGNAVEWEQLFPIKKTAEEKKIDATQILKKADEYSLDAKEVLKETKQSFIQALGYAELIKQSIIKNESMSELPNSNKIAYCVALHKGKFVPISIDVYNPSGDTQLQSITLKNGVPTQIVDYNDDATIRLSSFSDNSIIISDKVSLGGQRIGTGYVYTNGKVVSVRKNQTLGKFPYKVEESYFYNDDKLWISEQNTKMYQDGSRKIGDRYTYLDGKLLNYYSNFENSASNLYKWDESYHYNKQGEFIGTTANAGKQSLNNSLLAKTAVYSHFNKFIFANNVLCYINDSAPILFVES